MPDTPETRSRRERRGISASPGIGVGPAFVVDRRKVQVPHRAIERSEVAEETKRFRAALRRTHDQLETAKSRLSQGEHRLILKAQQMMLRDPDLLAHVDRLIEDELINAEWAVARVADDVGMALSKVADQSFRERQFDVAFLGEGIIRNLLGEGAEQISPPEGSVVVAHDLAPADTAQLHQQRVAGIVLEAGGRTSHTAIMARALDIPCVVAVEGLLASVSTGEQLIVHGSDGRVVFSPDEGDLAVTQAAVADYRAFESKVARQRALTATTKDGRRIALRANIALDAEIDAAVAHGAEGVGLYRTEYLFMGRETLPTEEEHYRSAKRVLAACAPYPVVVRVFDLGSDKSCRLFRHDPEANPAMGMRSMRLALRERDVLIAQLRGLLRAGVHGPLRILLPLIASLGELQQALEAVAEARAQLESEGRAFAPDVPVGTMIEVPAAAIIADILAIHVDFMSIGTNDLIQYSLAIDRENDDVNYLYEPLHPAILRMIDGTVKAAKAAGIPVSVCGEMASDPLLAWILLGLGVEELSMHPGAIPVIKSLVRESKSTEMQALAERVMTLRSAAQAERMVLEAMRARFPEHLAHGPGGGLTWASQDPS